MGRGDEAGPDSLALANGAWGWRWRVGRGGWGRRMAPLRSVSGRLEKGYYPAGEPGAEWAHAQSWPAVEAAEGSREQAGERQMKLICHFLLRTPFLAAVQALAGVGEFTWLDGPY